QGKPGKPRRPSATRPKPEPDDTPVKTFDLDYKDGKAAGTITLPPPAEGKVYWTRPVYVNGRGEKRWVGCTCHQPQVPIERKPAVLTVKPQAAATKPLQIISTATLKVVDNDGESHQLRIDMDSRFTETTQQVTEDGTATIRLQYTGFRLGFNVNGK